MFEGLTIIWRVQRTKCSISKLADLNQLMSQNISFCVVTVLWAGQRMNRGLIVDWRKGFSLAQNLVSHPAPYRIWIAGSLTIFNSAGARKADCLSVHSSELTAAWNCDLTSTYALIFTHRVSSTFNFSFYYERTCWKVFLAKEEEALWNEDRK